MRLLTKVSKIIAVTALALAIAATTVTPAYASNTHYVAFVYGNKQVIVPVEHGQNVVLPVDTQIPGYVFYGWMGNASCVTENRVLYGMYQPVNAGGVYYQPYYAVGMYQPLNTITVNQMVQQANQPTVPTYDVTVVDSVTGKQYSKQTVAEHRNADIPDLPSHRGYHFSRYDGSFSDITSSRVITAIFEPDYIIGDDGNLYKVVEDDDYIYYIPI